jgi:thiosulfate dehydrogenase [quinone] large subunit
MKTLKHRSLAFALIRVALGLNIFLHGAVRMGANYQKFINWTVGVFKDAPLPQFAVSAFAHVIPFWEISVGILLIVGLFTLPALLAGIVLMMALMSGMCIVQNWEIVGLQMLYIAIYGALLFSIHYDDFSIDHSFSKRFIAQSRE